MKTRTLSCAALALAALAAAAAGARKDGNAMDQTVRKPAVAGTFYDGNPSSLRAEIVRYLDAASPKAPAGDVVALVSPHAGYMYSGQVAAYGYRLVRGRRYDAVVVVSPCHVEHFAHASVFSGSAYVTPLGEIPVDAELGRLIASKSDLVKYDTRGHDSRGFQRAEHSLEVQLPFLQVALGEFKLVPIVMGDQSPLIVEALGKALGEALAGRNALVVASTDLSHFHDDRRARALDGRFQERLGAFDEKGLLDEIARGRTEACGGGPTVAAMIAAKSLGATKCQVLHYANSGEVTGERDNVVGYVSAAMIREKGGGKKAGEGKIGGEKAGGEKAGGGGESGAASSDLTRDDKVFLLALARSIIEAEVGGPKAKLIPPTSPVLREARGAFVTLHKNGRLRGCIGYIEALKPLLTTIEEMAKAAAFDDWRFSPVAADEVAQLDIEISVLSPITVVTDPSSIVVGKHGLIVTRGASRGLLLPQVATEWRWDRQTFLAQTCVKAGLPEGAWKEKGTKIECFTADVFSEKELGLR